MTTKYMIERTAPTTYIDGRGNAIQGFIVYFRIEQFDESHEVRVPSLNAGAVTKAIEAIVTNREGLANLGQTASK